MAMIAVGKAVKVGESGGGFNNHMTKRGSGKLGHVKN
jgi:hypothetical protein